MTNSMDVDIADIGLSDQDLSTFCEFFYRKTGIRLDGRKRYFLERRLIERARICGASSFRDYLGMLKFDRTGNEMEALISEMTVNETYFWRENYQFECMTKRMLDEVAVNKRTGERIRIWSVPCSTGEEPYTIAIHILEHWAKADQYDIEIYASDIDNAVLKQAAEGIYEERALSRLPAAYRNKYFRPLGERSWQIVDGLRGSITFARTNLADPVQTARFQGIDLIFCRNLLIYFDEASRRIAAENIHAALNPGGFVCLGHSESMSRISSLFRPRQFPEALVHQKPL